jgi:hypothetical protein
MMLFLTQCGTFWFKAIDLHSCIGEPAAGLLAVGNSEHLQQLPFLILYLHKSVILGEISQIWCSNSSPFPSFFTVITNISSISPQINGDCISPNSQDPPPTATSLSCDSRQRWLGGRWKTHSRKALLRRSWSSWTQGGGRWVSYIGKDYWWSVGASPPIIKKTVLVIINIILLGMKYWWAIGDALRTQWEVRVTFVWSSFCGNACLWRALVPGDDAAMMTAGRLVGRSVRYIDTSVKKKRYIDTYY